MALAASGPGPYYTLRLPMALESAAKRDDLGDLRVRNAGGESLPYAWTPEHAEADAPEPAAATIYEVPAPPPVATTASAPAPTPSRSWIVDTHDPGYALERLVLVLAPGTQGVFGLRVDASDDLQRWRPVRGDAQVVQLAPPAGAESRAPLESTAIELDDVTARYLRLSTAAGAPAPDMASAAVLRSRHPPLERAVAWSAPIAPVACDDRHCDYALPRNVPLEQLRIELAEPDTVGLVEVLAKVDVDETPLHRRHPLRGTLHALRARERAASGDANWAWVASENVYWLRDVGGVAELRSPPLRLDGAMPAMLRLQATGAMRRLGRTPPTLRVGAHPATLVFLAHGAPPFRLELAPPEEPAPAMTLAQLMPARGPDDPLPVDTATPILPVVAPAPATAADAAPTGGDPRWLWAALLAGVGLMAAMAWSLLRKPRAGG